ncbi:type II toxin-antitoxin system Phd/YefM family antitoxin [Streptococcus massiliensis]|uniref:Antitoxin n=1 Tax=Streptococcus massiliensis TaxID=313439 RepID=A0A380KV62_9STRE|nr:type II toxin-antitoxin system Phd/YefM family antitoxin [Streptococcus massiliensis]SUN75792.1 YefM family antitoxin [Streptococcus massiliensis]
MVTVSVSNFRKDVFSMIENTIKYNETLNITTKQGNAVVLSEEEYNDLIEMVYIQSIPHLKEDILEAMGTPTSDFIPEEEVDW